MLARASKSHVVNRKPYNKLKKEFDDETKRELQFVEICRTDAIRKIKNDRANKRKEKRVEKKLQSEVLKTFENMKSKSRMQSIAGLHPSSTTLRSMISSPSNMPNLPTNEHV